MISSNSGLDLAPLLSYINPAALSYQDWCGVGMALKTEGYPLSLWESWSRKDPTRYHEGECEKKWRSFEENTSTPVTGGTIVMLAKQGGWTPPRRETEGPEMDWDELICAKEDGLTVVDQNWVEGIPVQPPADWDPAKELIRYLETLFEAGENVGYVVKSYRQPETGKYLPANQGCFDRTAGQLIEELSRCGGDIGSVLGDYDPGAGAWIRCNPLDGKGVKNENVTEYRYALVESDNLPLEQQNALVRELELPIACLVYSGGKSLHAIVRIDAASYPEYRQRVDYLYKVCEKNGLSIDRQNRNPSRLSRMPGVVRGSKKQFLLDTNLGKSSFPEWKEWVESQSDDLPDPEPLSAVWDNLPPLSPPLIAGVLRQGHKMLLAGPSKAGKSFALIELCIAIAEGKKWLGFDCAQGRALYVNLELDQASCFHRFADVYQATGLAPEHLSNIDIWNLRGKSIPMDKLAPKLIRRAAKKNYIAVVIDPIYKIITGDENSADQMAAFCNQFDKVCTELGCAVIYCHHHSKGYQGGKRSMDRASGSGVFARDPDALLDLIELETTQSLLKAQEDKAVCQLCENAFRQAGFTDYSQDDACSPVQMQNLAKYALSPPQQALLTQSIERAKQQVSQRTAWRIEGTLREFPRFATVNLWFDFPIHRPDPTGALGDLDAKGEVSAPPWKKNLGPKKTSEQRGKERKVGIEKAFDVCIDGRESMPVSELAEYLGVTEKTVRRNIKEHGGFWVQDGKVGKKDKTERDNVPEKCP